MSTGEYTGTGPTGSDRYSRLPADSGGRPHIPADRLHVSHHGPAWFGHCRLSPVVHTSAALLARPDWLLVTIRFLISSASVFLPPITLVPSSYFFSLFSLSSLFLSSFLLPLHLLIILLPTLYAFPSSSPFPSPPPSLLSLSFFSCFSFFPSLFILLLTLSS